MRGPATAAALSNHEGGPGTGAARLHGSGWGILVSVEIGVQIRFAGGVYRATCDWCLACECIRGKEP